MIKITPNKADGSQLVHKLLNFAWQHEADRMQVLTAASDRQMSVSYFGGAEKLSDWVLARSEENQLWDKLLQLAKIRNDQSKGDFWAPGPQGALHCQVEKLAVSDGECLMIKITEAPANYNWSGAQFDEQSSELILNCLSGKGLGLISGEDGAWTTQLAYTLLTAISHEEYCLASLEAPVIKQLSGVNQCQWQKGRGRNYNQLFETILAQDPDIIYVSDLEQVDKHSLAVATSNKFIIGKLANHNILETIRDLMKNSQGREVLKNLKFLLQVYLVKKNCPNCLKSCRLAKTDSQHLAQIVGLEPEALAKMEFAESSGCQQCRASGNNDQMPLYDVLFPDAQLRQSLSKARFNQQSVEMIEEAMHLNALEDAWLKAGSQLISPWEIIHKFG